MLISLSSPKFIHSQWEVKIILNNCDERECATPGEIVMIEQSRPGHGQQLINSDRHEWKTVPSDFQFGDRRRLVMTGSLFIVYDLGRSISTAIVTIAAPSDVRRLQLQRS